MDINCYLNRIGLEPNISITKEYLDNLHEQHLLYIPFENIDIHYQTPISLNINEIYNKIVLNKRGGFCYELNGLFHALLTSIGFNAKLISCRVNTKNDVYSPEFDHVAILVQIKNEEYLVDVGFGDFISKPLPIWYNKEITDPNGIFLFEKHSLRGYTILSKIHNGNKQPEYIFKVSSRKLKQFSSMCLYHQTSPKSHMSKGMMITQAIKCGRITLTENSLTITKDGDKSKYEILPKNFDDFLSEYFKIELKKN